MAIQATLQTFTLTRTTAPDPAAVLAALTLIDPSIRIIDISVVPLMAADPIVDQWTYTLIHASALWSPGTLTAIQTALNAVPTSTPELTAQTTIANWPIEIRSLIFALLNQINLVGAALPVPLAAISPAAMLAAISAKASTL